MVNASLNWASIVGIVLAVCGAGLYFLRSFKPALARDYDVFFAYESVRLRGISTDQARRSSYFDDEPELPRSARGGLSDADSDSTVSYTHLTLPTKRIV